MEAAVVMERLTLKAGTAVLYCGVPIALTKDTDFETASGNVGVINEFPQELIDGANEAAQHGDTLAGDGGATDVN